MSNQLPSPKFMLIKHYTLNDRAVNDGVSIVVAENMTEVLEFAVKVLQSRGVVLCLEGEVILPGSSKLSGKTTNE